MTGPDIEALLRQDETVLRHKRKRLKTFAAALTEIRASHGRATELIAEMLEAGDLTRSDITQVFGLSKGERVTLVPPSTRTSRTDAENQRGGAVPAQENESRGDVHEALDHEPSREQD